jgi:HSP20 family protein
VTMMARREPARLEDLFDWVQQELLPMPAFGQCTGRHMMRVEEFLDEGDYVLRAELPGIDPERDVDITVENGVLTLRAERREEKREGGRSEFHYGTYTRGVTLPGGADEESVRATYTNGVLDVRVAVHAEEPTGARHIPISTTSRSRAEASAGGGGPEDTSSARTVQTAEQFGGDGDDRSA